ncbi:MAG: hypothetical protein D6737_09800 [Chloroflexi bacterium]|nr:MAG: hypothetical protein CUN54_05815 [Phototrophicales bacterium]RMF79957.1 MAG: hypothetical protein D6737_09800 [Chloroflexota bacterium]
MKSIFLLFVLSLVLIYPAQAQDTNTLQATLNTALNPVIVGDMLTSDDFTDKAAWEPFIDEGSDLRVANGQYRMEVKRPETFVWEAIQTNYSDVVIEADVAFENSANIDASAGIMCRMQTYLDPQGYFFEVTPLGEYLITRFADGEFVTIAEGQHTGAIQQNNHLIAVCVDDYLAFYSNGQLLTETVDPTFSDGFVSWTASLYTGEPPFVVNVDNVTVWAAAEPVEVAMQRPRADLSQGSVEIDVLRHILQEPFNRPDAWLPFVQEGIDFGVEDGVYAATIRDDQSAWANNGNLMRDTIIEVDIQQSGSTDINATGVICRSDTGNNGYRFWIGGDGLYNIARWVEGERTDLITNPEPITNLQPINTLTAVCLDNYLALYVNGDLIAEAKDNTHTEGVTGIFASVIGEGEFLEAQLDNLNIWTIAERS